MGQVAAIETSLDEEGQREIGAISRGLRSPEFPLRRPSGLGAPARVEFSQALRLAPLFNCHRVLLLAQARIRNRLVADRWPPSGGSLFSHHIHRARTAIMLNPAAASSHFCHRSPRTSNSVLTMSTLAMYMNVPAPTQSKIASNN